MRTYDELDRLWKAAAPPPQGRGTVGSLCLRLGGGRHAAVEQVELTRDGGVVGDRWQLAADPQRQSQVTLMNLTVARLVASDHRPLHDAGDNLFVDLDLSEAALALGARLHVGDAVLEVTPKPHTGCRKFSARFGLEALRWLSAPQNASARLRGVHCEVLTPGRVRVGDAIEVVSG